MAHVNAGAKKVIISAPAKGDLKTVVYNVNENVLDGSEQVLPRLALIPFLWATSKIAWSFV